MISVWFTTVPQVPYFSDSLLSLAKLKRPDHQININVRFFFFDKRRQTNEFILFVT